MEMFCSILHRYFSRLVVVAILSAWFTCRGDDTSNFRATASREQQISYIIGELQRCPLWTSLRPDEMHLAAGVVQIYEGIAEFDEDIVREALVEVQCGSAALSTRRLDSLAKLYLVARFMFEVPDSVPASLLRHTGAWQFPWTDETYNPLWPLRREVNGSLVLAGRSSFYHGAEYDIVGEFDEFSRQFCPRAAHFSPHAAIAPTDKYNTAKAAEPGATDNPDRAQRLREDH